ncbi:MAG: hypothetical protein FH751_15160 [Firmicutes bacterium]|nr:hypothetical protein [Bacillota bacterium]
MSKTLSLQLQNDMDSLMRVLSTLRRKKFNISNVNMKKTSDTDSSKLFITIEDHLGLGINQAVKQMKKLVDVTEIKELKEEI